MVFDEDVVTGIYVNMSSSPLTGFDNAAVSVYLLTHSQIIFKTNSRFIITRLNVAQIVNSVCLPVCLPFV